MLSESASAERGVTVRRDLTTRASPPSTSKAGHAHHGDPHFPHRRRPMSSSPGQARPNDASFCGLCGYQVAEVARCESGGASRLGRDDRAGRQP